MNKITKYKEFCLWEIAENAYELSLSATREVPDWVQHNIAFPHGFEIIADLMPNVESLYFFDKSEMDNPHFPLKLRDQAFEDYVATMIVSPKIVIPEETWETIENLLYDTATTGYIVIPTWSNPEGIFEGPPQIRKMWDMKDRVMGAIEEPQIIFSLYGDVEDLSEENWKWELLSKLGISGPWREELPYSPDKMSSYAGMIPVLGYVQRTGEK